MNDAYYTPDDVAAKCLATLKLRPGERVLEPSVGGGAFARGARAAGCKVIGCDIDYDARGFVDCDWSLIGDFTRWRRSDLTGGAVDWVLGNPPYSHAQEHIESAFTLEPTYGVAFLLRLAFLECEKRRAFWAAHAPREVHVLINRPSFTGGGSDSAAYGWFVWTMRGRATPTLVWL